MDLFDLYQQNQIRGQARDLRQNAENMTHNRQHMNQQVNNVDDRIDHLNLLCEAMWALITETTALTTEDLARKAHELDMLDGTRDGRHQGMAVDCSCGAKIGPKADNCQFCGTPAPERSAFEAI